MYVARSYVGLALYVGLSCVTLRQSASQGEL